MQHTGRMGEVQANIRNSPGGEVVTPGGSGTRLHAALWIAQVLLFLAFAGAGLVKLTVPLAQLAPVMPWVSDAPQALVRFIGAAEVAGALGVLLPAWTRIRPALTPLAALGLTIVMALATVVHLVRGETAAAIVPLVLGVLAGVVAWGRVTRAPITPRAGLRLSPSRVDLEAH